MLGRGLTPMLAAIVAINAQLSTGAELSGRDGEWRTVGGDSFNARHSPLAQINTNNVSTLGGAWVRELTTPTRTPPVMAGGLLFINDSRVIYAIEPTTGRTIWEYQPVSSAPARGGVALGEGLVFCGLADTHVIALDQKTGKLVWTGYIGNAAPESAGSLPQVRYSADMPAFNPSIGFISGAPTYVNGVVTVGLSGGDGGARGKIAALEAKTGKLMWVFDVIPRAGQPGSETWGRDPLARERGGGAVWTQGAADAELALVYYGTGNAVPMAGGETRPGDNLYTASIVALDVKTGRLRWYFQLVHHDLWDSDVATPVVLYTAYVEGQPRKSLAVARTDGYLFMLDRATGKPVRPIEERAVKQDSRLLTAPTQPFPVGTAELGPPCANAETAPEYFTFGCYFDPIDSDGPSVIVPLGTMRMAPMSYDPDTGYFYAMGGIHPFWYRRMADPFAVKVSHPPGSTQYGIYAAIDGRTGRIVWQRRSSWDLEIGSGALTTAGGLLFYMEADGTFQANDARTGRTLWRFQTGSLSVSGPGGPTSGVPAATYEANGVQYVVVPMGRALWAFKLAGSLAARPAPPLPQRVTGFDGMVHTFSKDGSAEITIGVGKTENWSPQSPGAVLDESGIVPLRTSAEANVDIKWTNRGAVPHTIAARDGSWKVGPIAPGSSVRMSISKPGSYVFSSLEAPWSAGQLIIHGAGGASRAGRGTYTLAQASRGEKLSAEFCFACHGSDLGGLDLAPPLAGDSFLQHWAGHDLNELYQIVFTTMPKQRPHSLSEQAYADIIAFLLQANGFPSGARELKADGATLAKIRLTPVGNPD
jgi:quinohemoprotein ethanol dehydrogenase